MNIYSINVNAVTKRIFNTNCFFCILFLSCSVGSSEVEKINYIMQEQESAWNKGDIDAFMKGYLNSDSLVFIGKNGLKYGWNTTLENYKKSYPDKNSMGKLKFDNIKIDILNSENAFVVGTWTIYRESDTIGGFYSLLWKKVEGKWCIVADHSS